MQNDLNALGGEPFTHPFTHLMAGYHKPMRPHNSGKANGTTEYDAWAQLFYDYRFDLIFESDSHTMKRTEPIVPSVDAGSDEGFITSIGDGTVYTGEGCWGAPLRANDDDKAWTLDSGQFNAFDLVYVYSDYSEVFTVKVDNEENVAALAEGDTFSLPAGIDLWQATGGTRLVVNRGATPKTSYAQYQLDTFGANVPAAGTQGSEDSDGDGLSNYEEFVFGLNAAVADSNAAVNAVQPLFEIGPLSEKRFQHQRGTNISVNFKYYISEDLQTWTLLEQDVDFTESSTSSNGVDQVEVEVVGPKASYQKAFYRVVNE